MLDGLGTSYIDYHVPQIRNPCKDKRLHTESRSPKKINCDDNVKFKDLINLALTSDDRVKKVIEGSGVFNDYLQNRALKAVAVEFALLRWTDEALTIVQEITYTLKNEALVAVTTALASKGWIDEAKNVVQLHLTDHSFRRMALRNIGKFADQFVKRR